MSTILECPKCGTIRDSDDIVVTWEHNQQPGVAYSIKKIVRTTIQTTYSSMDEDETLIHVCGLCEYEWSEPVLDAPVVGAVQNDFNPSGEIPYTYTVDEGVMALGDSVELPISHPGWGHIPKVFPTFDDRDDIGMMGEAHFEFMRHVED